MGFDEIKYIKMLLHWTNSVIIKLPDIENSLVMKKYGEGIIMHRKEVVKMRERGR